MAERQKIQRGLPAHKRLSEGTLAKMWSNDGLLAQAPPREQVEDNLYGNFDLAVDGAVDKASENFRSTKERDRAEFARRQAQRLAREQAGRPGAAKAAADLAGEAAAAERKQLLDSLTPEERNAILGDLLTRERDESEAMVSLEDDDDELTAFNWADVQDEADAQELDAGVDTEYAPGFEGYGEATQAAAEGVLEDLAGDE